MRLAENPWDRSERETIQALQNEGFNRTYGVHGTAVLDQDSHRLYSPACFRICKMYRFEGITDPSDESIVMAIEHIQEAQKGVLVVAYGPMSSPEEQHVLQKLHEPREEISANRSYRHTA